MLLTSLYVHWLTDDLYSILIPHLLFSVDEQIPTDLGFYG